MRCTKGVFGTCRSRSLSFAAGAWLSALTACAVPEAPEWDVDIQVPFSSDPVSIIDFLPLDENGDTIIRVSSVDGVSIFVVDVQEDSINYSLGQMCSDCRTYHGSAVAVPGFDYVDSLDVSFPEKLISLEILSARVGTRLRNDLNFDPLRPNADPDLAGYLAIAVRDLGSGVLLDSVLVSGVEQGLPAGTEKTFELQVNGVEISGGLRTIFYVHSPEDAQVAQIDTAMNARLASFIDQIQVEAVTALVETDTLEESFIVDVDEDVRDELRDRVQGGSYELELQHDVEADGALEVSIAGSAGDLFSGDPTREVRLTDLALTPYLVQTGQLSVDEVERVIDYFDVYIGYRAIAFGTRTGAGGQINLSRFTPDQLIQTRLKVTTQVRIGDL
ncbi:MAG: hypothetical protein JSU87_07150 [Gemmatimonadota bacterium]|nr:MAG: hypothetical protein JSU87_07150 [Gemmatimonadota bacterium]